MCGRRFGGCDVGNFFRWALSCLLLCLIVLVCAPRVAFAADYACSEVDLTAQVQTDGAVAITDQRIFEVTAQGGGRETLKWLYDGFIDGAEVTIERVRMAPVDADGALTAEWTELVETTFNLSWRSGAGPAHDAWAYDKFQHSLYAFVGNLPDRVVFEVTYRVTGAIEAFDDAADFQWLYVPQDYAVALEDVRAEVILPVAADDTVRPMENVYAWGHGPADGTVDIRPDGTIIFDDPQVEPSMYAKARVMFPVEWLTNLSEAARLANQGTLQYYWTSEYEAGWVDTDTSREVIRLGLVMGLLGLAAVLLVASLLVWLRWGRDRSPEFRGDYWMDEPEEGMAPAVLGRLWRWNHESPDDIVATVLDMVRRGVLVARDGSLAVGETVPRRGVSSSEASAALRAEGVGEDETPLRGAVSPSCDADVAALDEATLRLLRVLAPGGRALSAAQLSAVAHEHPRDFLTAVLSWQRTLTALVEPWHFFDRASRRAQHVVLGAALALALLSLAALIWLDVQAGVLGLLAAVGCGVLGNYTMRRTSEGNEIAAHAKALRNWMRDGGWVLEGDRLTPEERAALVPYAYLFGVLKCLGPLASDGDEAARALATLAPALSKSLDEALRVAHQRAEVS
ncbi:DUF2207 domain-containing protein [uncultured Adlercreutzia sp.]|uniref:DUF2207 family protein n=1 Tax=uncultured Adlercreutzia sp. TaxID=875803 RepID=UPI0025F4CDB9|nr:DUF2207 domain-containing protein [uncultured Adlercreutzia sp.]